MNLLVQIKERTQRLSPTSRKGLRGVGWAGCNQAVMCVVRLRSGPILTLWLNVDRVFGLRLVPPLKKDEQARRMPRYDSPEFCCHLHRWQFWEPRARLLRAGRRAAPPAERP